MSPFPFPPTRTGKVLPRTEIVFPRHKIVFLFSVTFMPGDDLVRPVRKTKTKIFSTLPFAFHTSVL